MRHFFIFLFLLSPLSIIAQEDQCKRQVNALVKTYAAQQLQKTADSLITFCEANHGLENALSVAHALAINRFYARDYTTAIRYSLVELDYYQRLERYNVKYNDVLYNLGRFNQLDGQLKESYAYYKKIISLKIDSATTAKVYCQMGELEYAQSDPYSAVLYYKKGIAMYQQMGRRATLVRKLLDLARIYERINDPESLREKLYCLRRIDSLLPNTKVSTRNRMIHNNHYASYYNNPSTFDFAKSSFYYKKNVQQALTLKDTVLLSATYANVANLYFKNLNDSAKFFIERALSFNNSKVDHARILNIQTNYLLSKGEDLKALQAIHQSLMLSTDSQFSLEELPSFDQLEAAPDKKLLLWGLSKRSIIYINQYKKSKQTAVLAKALSSIQLADLLIDQMYLGADQIASKLLWRKTASSIYGMGVFAANGLNNAADAFYFAEKKKAVLLTQEVVINSSKQFLPKQLVAAQNKLLRIRNHLEFLLDNTTRKQEKQAIEDSIFTINSSYLELQDSIALAYPDYAQMINKTALVSLFEAQKNLDKNTAVLHFIWDDQEAQNSLPGLMIITANCTSYFELKNPDSILKNINAYNETITTPFTTKKSQDDYFSLSNTLYNQLFINAKTQKLLANKNLIIIPDGPLYNVAFEALVVNPKLASYLIEQHQVSYAQSLSFKQINNQLERSFKHDYVGFAPGNYSLKELTSLNYAQEEVNQALSIFNGLSYKNHEASRLHFIEQIGTSNIVHLATHAQSKENSWIALNDSLVSLHELYSLKVPAQVVMLSGCGTNLGKSLEGEGVASLARGFFYAGANSVISTLWNTNDKTTATISTLFYEQLKKGKSKAAALQFAKVTYLKNASLSDASPYYWASMVLMGDEQKLSSKDSFWTQLFWLLLLLVLSGLILFKKNV